jgi:hypothetical protein
MPAGGDVWFTTIGWRDETFFHSQIKDVMAMESAEISPS